MMMININQLLNLIKNKSILDQIEILLIYYKFQLSQIPNYNIFIDKLFIKYLMIITEINTIVNIKD